MIKINIVVLDYSCGTVTHFENISIPKQKKGQDESEVIEDFLRKQEFHLSNCSWMSSHEKIDFIDIEL